MKKYCFLFALLFITVCGFSQELKLKKYTHTQFFKMIKAEKDSVFTLKDALITYNEATDTIYSYTTTDIGEHHFSSTDTLTINKVIELENVHFIHQNGIEGQALNHIVFNKEVYLYNSSSALFYNCVFNGSLEIDVDIPLNKLLKNIENYYDNYEAEIGFSNCIFKSDIIIDIGTIESFSSIDVIVENSKFYTQKNKTEAEIAVNNIRSVTIKNNHFFGNSFLNLFIDTVNSTLFTNNNFGDVRLDFLKATLNASQLCTVEGNTFNKNVIVTIDSFDPNQIYRWNQWRNKITTNYGYELYVDSLLEKELDTDINFNELYQNDSIFNIYKDKYRFEMEKAYKYEMRLLGNFYDFYKAQHDSDFANDVYIELKNLETQRYAYLYHKQPSFSNYFTWKINQFLKMFSDYGTKPSKAIIVSIYVIIFFAFVYLVFPNNWETKSKNKLMDRLKLFAKYFRKNEGIKEIYEEEQQHKTMSFEEFRTYMNESKKEIPIYFLWLAKPIYYFSSYNYKLTSRFLKYTDILKGKWVDLSPKRRFATSLIMGFWIFILIVVNIFIKFLNALTLSINMFTTLGFGEIPIKGLPRYLAIIQGFIGWFMLTIFSVSLISQLLN